MESIFKYTITAVLSGCKDSSCNPERIVVGANDTVLSVCVLTDSVPELESIPEDADEVLVVRFYPDGTRCDSSCINGTYKENVATEDNAPTGLLVRMAWKTPFRDEDVITGFRAKSILEAVWADYLPESEVLPEFFFNGEKMVLKASALKTSAKSREHRTPVITPSESVPVPEMLYYGTSEDRIWDIRQNGITKGDRMYIYLASDRVLARQLGQKEGEPVVLTVSASRLASDGLPLEKATDSIWIADFIPIEYLSIDVQ